MTPTELAHKYLGPFKVQGREAIPELCPFCQGGGHDKKTFALNLDDGAYNCKRGHCGAQGSFTQLLEHFGEQKSEPKPQAKQKYKAPTTVVQAPKPQVEQYLLARGFSKATWERYGVGDDGKGNVAMPYVEDSVVCMVKFREAKKGGKKGWREPGGKPVFWGMHLCNVHNPWGDPIPLVVTEGEMDTLALAEAGIDNVVSMPSGSQDLTCLDLCWDWLQQWKQIVIWVDADEPGQALQRALISKLGSWRCLTVDGKGFKDANEMLLAQGVAAVRSAWSARKEVPQAGLMRLADAPTFDFSKAVRVMTGIKGIDKVLGGSFMGMTSVWTGKSTAGKSTLLGQVLLNAIDQGYAVCAYSGELPAAIFRYWVDLQAAGKDNITEEYDDRRDGYVAKVSPEITARIREWYRDKFFLYDSFSAPNEASIFEVFTYAAKRHDCKIFMIDNLMTLMLEAADGGDWWGQQRSIINKVCNFDRVMNVHTHVVVHPKKTRGNVEREDVGGVSELTARVDNVLIHKRLTDDEIAEEVRNGNGAINAILTVDKNRLLGVQGKEIELVFEDRSKRFSMPSDGEMAYGWQRQPGEDDD